MRAFIAIIIKDLRVRFSSRTELVFFILLPVVFTVVLAGGSLGGSKGQASTQKPLPLVLFQDTVGSTQAKAFGALLATMPGVRVKAVSDPTELIGSAQADLLVTVTPAQDPRSGLPFAVGLRLSPWRDAAATAQAVGAWLKAGAGAGAGAPTAPPDAAPVDPAPAASAAMPSAAEIGSAGQIVTWVLVPLLGLGAGLIAERRRGTMSRIYAAPVSPAVAVAGSVAAEVIGALAQIAILAAVGSLVFGLPWASHPGQLLALSVAFCVTGAAVGALLGVLCRTSRQAGNLALALAMVLAVFGGCWYPSALFPASMRALTRLDPAGWAMNGFLAVLSPAAHPGDALSNAALLAGFGLVVFALAALVSRTRRASLAG